MANHTDRVTSSATLSPKQAGAPSFPTGVAPVPQRVSVFLLPPPLRVRVIPRTPWVGVDEIYFLPLFSCLF